MIKKPFELLSIGISKGEVKSASKEIKTEISSLTAIPGKVLVKTSDDNFIFCFESSDLSRQPVKVEGEIQGGIFAVSQDGATVALAGEKGIETYDSAGMQLLKKINNDGHMIPDNAVFTGKNGWIAISACSKPGYIFKDGQKKEFCDMTGKAIMFNADGNILAFEKYLNSEIVLIEFPELAEIGKWTPSGMKPKTQGSAVFMAYLKHLGKYAVLDSYGNLCLYSKPAKSVKWSKKLIFSSKK
jgi:hypothetical protein